MKRKKKIFQDHQSSDETSSFSSEDSAKGQGDQTPPNTFFINTSMQVTTKDAPTPDSIAECPQIKTEPEEILEVDDMRTSEADSGVEDIKTGITLHLR